MNRLTNAMGFFKKLFLLVGMFIILVLVCPPDASAAAEKVTPVARKQAIPSGLFKMDDRAIIIVSGRRVAAGDVKRQILAELQKQSGPAQVVSGPSRLQPIPAKTMTHVPGGIAKLFPKPAERKAAIGKGYTDTKLGAGKMATALKENSYIHARDYCLKHTAEISRVRGVITPNGRFTIEGLCFGDQTGAIEAIGQFPGGKLRLVFERWSDNEITAFVPAVSGAPDHSIALTVVRLDKMRSPALQARFVATRERVQVPGRFWSPTENFAQVDVDQGGGNIFSGFRVWGAGAASRVTPFALAINPACALDSASWSTTAGRIDAFNGWENGPPNQANVEIVWTPRCTTQTTNYIVASSSQRICSIQFALSAWAACPVGVSP